MATRTQINTYLQNNREQLEAIQEDWKALYRKYRQYKRGELHEALEIHEYVRPDGGVGYVAFLHAEEGADHYIRTFHIGNEPRPALTAWSLVIESET
jgi:NurA-like 5'-3' nuclease